MAKPLRKTVVTIHRKQPARAARLASAATSPVKQEPGSTPLSSNKRALSSQSTNRTPKKQKTEDDDLSKSLYDIPLAGNTQNGTTPSPTKKQTAIEDKSDVLHAKKLTSYTKHNHQSPFPEWPYPTPEDCKLAHRILRRLHGPRTRPKKIVADPNRAGCGDSPSVLDALVRTILSQHTTDTNSSRAKRSMDSTYGRNKDPEEYWSAVERGGREKLQEAIKCGGLSKVKAGVILSVLEQVRERYGRYSLDHLHNTTSSDEVMQELLSFKGVGPKTASCVLLFCLGRESFAVDTHVWRISGILGWRPLKATRDETHLHLDARIPGEDKYGLHVLMVTHGKKCGECAKLDGRPEGEVLEGKGPREWKCELRRGFEGRCLPSVVEGKGVGKGEKVKAES